MRRLLPTPADHVDPLDCYLADGRPRPAGRPWVTAMMIASVDGAVVLDGVSGGLGGAGDAAVFRAVRAGCDWILVGAATARAERYRPPRPDHEVRARRIDAGREPAPRLAVVSASLDLDDDAPLLTDRHPEDPIPLVLTGEHPPPERVAALRDRLEIVRLPGPRPTSATILAELDRRGAGVVLSEGGPTLNGQLAADGVVDELCLTVSPLLVGGPSPRLAHAPVPGTTTPLALDRLLTDDEGYLYARYVRR